MKPCLLARCSAARTRADRAVMTGNVNTMREGAMEADMPANWMLLFFLLPLIWMPPWI
jgi:hypothetical protein